MCGGFCGVGLGFLLFLVLGLGFQGVSWFWVLLRIALCLMVLSGCCRSCVVVIYITADLLGYLVVLGFAGVVLIWCFGLVWPLWVFWAWLDSRFLGFGYLALGCDLALRVSPGL